MNALDYALWGLSPASFATEALGFSPDKWQQEFLDTDERKIILNCSRQSGKSTTAAILALHRALFFFNQLIILVSPSQRQSSELFRKVIDHMQRLSVQPRRIEDNRLSMKFDNLSRIISLPSGADTIRGFSSVNLLIEDEAAFVDDSLYVSVRPMMAVSNGKMVLMSTPHGKRGHFYEAWRSDPDGSASKASWWKASVTADQCPRIGKEFLESERKALGHQAFRQEYECEFLDTVDSIFLTHHIEAAYTDEVEPLDV